MLLCISTLSLAFFHRWHVRVALFLATLDPSMCCISHCILVGTSITHDRTCSISWLFWRLQ
jgi:hypothetical protein